MPHLSIAEYLMKQPDDNKGKMAMIKGKALAYQKKARKDYTGRPKMTDDEIKKRKREQYRASIATPEGRQLFRDRNKKLYWQNIELSRAKQRAYRKDNKELIKAKYEAKKQAKKIICI